MTSPKRLLVRVDDAGTSWASNVGCLQACTQGIARSVEVMMPGAWITHAASLFNQHPEIDIGIHLTLTSEWDAVKWRPLTRAPSLTDKHGYFLPRLIPRDKNDRACLAHAPWRLDEIAAEFRAQIAQGVAMFPNASHVSAHMIRHFKDFDPLLGDVVSDLCAEFGLADDAFGQGLPRLQAYPPFPRNAAVRVAAFQKSLSALPDGTHVFIDHPAAPSAELDAMGHKGYEDVRADRISCLETLTSPALAAHIDRLGISLISYQDL